MSCGRGRGWWSDRPEFHLWPPVRISVLTIFPGLIHGSLADGIVARAVKRGLVELVPVDVRHFAYDRHRMTDDYPYGGGQGMVMRPEPVFRALEWCVGRPVVPGQHQAVAGERVVLLAPWGRPFDQGLAWELAQDDHLVLISGRYEGIDERVTETATDVVSIGDYVLSGGELAAAVIIDAVVRLLPDAVGDQRSVVDDSFATGLLEGPQYTRPRSYRGLDVPSVLLSGHHGEISKWRQEQAILRTRSLRPDLLGDARDPEGPGQGDC